MKNFKILNNNTLITSAKGKIIFFILALLVNVFWLYTSKLTHNPNGNALYISGIELQKDLSAAENFIKTGNYYFGNNFWGDNDYTYRLPGFLFVYIPFRLFFGIHGALTAIVILQLLLSALASIALSRIAYNLTGKPILFYLTFILFLGSAYVQQYNFGLNREGLTTYVLIFALLFLQKWNTKPKYYLIFIFSSLLTWCYLYRAFLIPPIFLIIAIILFYQWNKNKKLPIKLAVIIFLPSFIFFSYWIPRNYILTKKIIPLETCFQYQKSFYGIMHLIQTWGGEVLPWIDNSPASWFNKPEIGKNITASDSIIPAFLFNDSLTIDTLKKARNYYWLTFNDTIDKNKRLEYDENGAKILDKFITFQKNKFPLRSYITSKLIYLYTFLNQPIGLRTCNLKYPLNVVFTFSTSLINYFVLFIGFFASIILLFYKKYYNKLFFGEIIIFILIILFIVFYTIELRRIAHLFPFLLINALFLMNIIFEKNKKIGYTIILLIIPILSILAIYSCSININW